MSWVTAFLLGLIAGVLWGQASVFSWLKRKRRIKSGGWWYTAEEDPDV